MRCLMVRIWGEVICAIRFQAAQRLIGEKIARIKNRLKKLGQLQNEYWGGKFLVLQA